MEIEEWEKMKEENLSNITLLQINALRNFPWNDILEDLRVCTHQRTLMDLVSTSLFTSKFKCTSCSKFFFKSGSFFQSPKLVGCLQCDVYTCASCYGSVLGLEKKAIGTCGHCDKTILAKLKCPCGKIYCSRSHQKKNWRRHRIWCPDRLNCIN